MKCWAWLGLAALVAACDPGALRAPDEPVNWVVDGPLADATDELGVTPPVEPGLPFNRVALRWDAPEDISFQARARAADGTWGPWTPVERTWSEEGMHVGRAELPADSRAWQLQVAPAEAAERVSFIEAEVLTGELETPPEETYDPAEEATPLPDLGELIDLDLDEPLEVEGVPEDGFEQFIEKSRPAIVSRASWGARAPRCSYGSHRPNRLTIHHTVTPNNDAMSAPARVRQIQAFHQSGRGWCDIGYHFLVARDGRVFQGRPHDRLGAHVANANSGNVGISFLGTYTSANPTAAQLRSAAAVVRWIATSYNISRDRTHVKGHRQYGGTSCPGDRLYARLPDIVRMSRQADGGGNAGGGGGNAAPAPQDGVLTGIIHVNGDTDRRIAGATVRLGDRSMRTGADGLYRFRVPPGRYSVRVSKDGWQAGTSSTQDVRSGHTRWASVGLRRPPAAQPTGSLVGVVFQAPDDTRRLANATVRLSTGQTVRTNDHGVYRATVRAGDVRITATKTGFREASVTRTVPRDGEIWGSVGLRRQ
ncbi:MAG: N-acetylmuramoyl-L-alanine amidase [Myxococcales bacterium]|nr:N-acetylmuramoyl-L-alanine amidase [Myxococcales bacterium]